MSDVQVIGLTAARERLLRARKELEQWKIRDTTYRGVHYFPERSAKVTRGDFAYRGIAYSK